MCRFTESNVEDTALRDALLLKLLTGELLLSACDAQAGVPDKLGLVNS